MMSWKKSSISWIKQNCNCCTEDTVLRQKVNKLSILFMFCWLLASNNIFSQQDTLRLSVDSVITPDKSKAERVLSPHKASFYSAILPGLGQAYNRKYWKIPILYAGIGAMGYAISFNAKYYRGYKAAYRDFIIQDPNNKSYLEYLPPTWTEEDLESTQNATWFESALGNKKDYYRRYRDLSFIGMALIYMLNLVDASVDAHLSSFDISDDLSIKIDPVIIDSYQSKNAGAGLKLSFNF